MPTIKTKKEMNLPELIEWGFNNNVTGSYFAIDGVYAKRIRFESGVFVGMNGEFNKDDTFKLDIEEEITEDMKIKGLVELGNDGHGTDFFQCNGSSINEQKDFDSEAFYILNDDKTMTLIWTRDGKLVE
ncbi:hypothetical protein [Mammaliicoccus sciuri]|uniref:hypothetical protein n=1 Tax=Mammaliicoccus sciuri TaxID=1296 RepID=UPI002DBE5D60|nr:hypothetical protein [Mammaliicoccus sciuri]MEB5757425.1 hypothetical protein [Mammaliicoccus sciuri]